MRALSAAIAVLLAGCSGKARVTIHTDLPSAQPVEVLVFGKSIGTFTGGDLSLEIPQGATDPASGVTYRGLVHDEALIARVVTACGAVDYCVGFSVGPSQGLDPNTGHFVGRKRPTFGLCTAELVEVLVDNRGGPSRSLTVGSFQRTVGANATARFKIVAPPCAAQARVLLDGEDLGRLPVADEEFKQFVPTFVNYASWSDGVLIDTSGTRCYKLSTHAYGLATTINQPEILKPKKLRDLMVSDFLTPSPKSVDSPHAGASRSELLDEPCP